MNGRDRVQVDDAVVGARLDGGGTAWRRRGRRGAHGEDAFARRALDALAGELLLDRVRLAAQAGDDDRHRVAPGGRKASPLSTGERWHSYPNRTRRAAG